MTLKSISEHFDIFKESRELGVSLWECPNFLFTLMGFFTVVSMIITYSVGRLYYEVDAVFFVISIGVIIMVIFMFLIDRGIKKIIDSEKRLKRAHQELKEAFAKLEEAEKMRIEFTSMMIHDLRSPLTGVRLLTELIQGKPQEDLDPKIFKESIAMINYNVNTVLSLVNEIFEIAKMRTRRFKISKEKGDLKEILLRVHKFFQTFAASKNLKLEIERDHQIPIFDFDSQKVEQVVYNLLTNAIKYTPSGGKVIIQALSHEKGGSLEEESKKAGLHWRLHDQVEKLKNLPPSVVVAITDTGIGLSNEDKEDIFDELNQIRQVKTIAQKVSGLGLVICRGIVEAHQGIIGVESKEKEGSTFYFSLPLN